VRINWLGTVLTDFPIGADNYSQDVYNGEAAANPAFSRVRSNSYNSHPGQSSELGPLAHIPSPDPDQIDGLHRHPSHSSSNSHTGGNAPSSPPLHSSPSDTPDHPPEKERSMFTLSNSSAPALSTMPRSPPTLTHRSATTPAKRLVFANNLSVYDTFSSAVYDRRSEPATWSRLTPALAQRIKEELNSYKMEEMEVHTCSRMQCVPSTFFLFLTNSRAVLNSSSDRVHLLLVWCSFVSIFWLHFRFPVLLLTQRTLSPPSLTSDLKTQHAMYEHSHSHSHLQAAALHSITVFH
jgi:hypothetical protein